MGTGLLSGKMMQDTLQAANAITLKNYESGRS
jgi:hypothetical protein